MCMYAYPSVEQRVMRVAGRAGRRILGVSSGSVLGDRRCPKVLYYTQAPVT